MYSPQKYRMFSYRQFLKHRHVLHDDADMALEVIRVGRHGRIEQPDRALVKRQKREDTVDRRGLSGAVGAQKAKDLAFFNVQIQMVQRQQLP